jgi:hypothetical protein
MAENVLITPGTGDTVGADEISSVKYQRIKLIYGADGVNSGDVSSTNPLPTTANPSKLATTDDAEFVRKYYTNAGAVTDGIVWSPAAGKRWYITDIIVNTSAAAVITFEDDKAGGDDPVLKLELAANGGLVSNFKTPLASGEDAADLLVTTSAGNIYICCVGYEV